MLKSPPAGRYVLLAVVPIVAFATFTLALSPADITRLITHATANFVFNDTDHPVHIAVDSAASSTPPQVNVQVNASTTPPNVQVNVTATSTPVNVQVSATSGIITISGTDMCPAGFSQVYAGRRYAIALRSGSISIDSGTWQIDNGTCWQSPPSDAVVSSRLGSCAVCQR